jgi:hypothetical protein
MNVAARELRGSLTVVPETRWLKDSAMLRFFVVYEAHRDDLQAVLAAGRR